MTESVIELVRRGFEANRSGPAEETVEVVVAICDPRIAFTSRLTAVEGAAYLGHDGVRAYFIDMADAWREWRNEIHEAVEVAPDTVLVAFTFRGAGKTSDVDIELSQAAVIRLSQGKVLQIQIFPTRAEALRATESAE